MLCHYSYETSKVLNMKILATNKVKGYFGIYISGSKSMSMWFKERCRISLLVVLIEYMAYSLKIIMAKFWHIFSGIKLSFWFPLIKL